MAPKRRRAASVSTNARSKEPATKSTSSKTPISKITAAANRSTAPPEIGERRPARSTRSNPPKYDLRKTYVPYIPPPGQKLTYRPSRSIAFLEQLDAEADQRKKRRKSVGASAMTNADKRAAAGRAQAHACANEREVRAASTTKEVQKPGGFIREDQDEDGDDSRASDSFGDNILSDGLPHETEVERRHRLFYEAKENFKNAIHKDRVQKYRRLTAEELEELSSDQDPDEPVVTDELEYESRAAIIGGDFKLEIEVKAYIGRALVLRQSLNEFTRRDFEIGIVEEPVAEKVFKIPANQALELVAATVCYKPTRGNHSFQYTTIETLDIESGEKLMSEIDRHRLDYDVNSPYRVIFTLKYATGNGVTTSKRASTAGETPRASRVIPVTISSSPPPPLTAHKQDTFRTKELKERLGVNADNYRVRGENQQVLIERYNCIDRSCPNYPNFCWVDNVAKDHYKIEMVQFKQWSSAIEAGRASLDNPPNELVLFWVKQQKPVGVAVDKKGRLTVKSLDERQAAFEERQLEVQMRQQEAALLRAEEEAEEKRLRAEYRRRELDEREQDRRDKREDMQQDREDRREERREERELQQEQRRQLRSQQQANSLAFSTRKYTNFVVSLFLCQ
jgi:hypothetical protein